MLYTEKEKHEIERVKEVFAEHLRQSPDFELFWSDKVGYVWLAIGVNPLYVDTGIRIGGYAPDRHGQIGSQRFYQCFRPSWNCPAFAPAPHRFGIYPRRHCP